MAEQTRLRPHEVIKDHSEDEGMVQCPVCGFECTHVESVGIESDGHMDVIRAERHYVFNGVPSNGYRNCCAILTFWGECGHRFSLKFGCHKGNVFMTTEELPSKD